MVARISEIDDVITRLLPLAVCIFGFVLLWLKLHRMDNTLEQIEQPRPGARARARRQGNKSPGAFVTPADTRPPERRKTLAEAFAPPDPDPASYRDDTTEPAHRQRRRLYLIQADRPEQIASEGL